MGGRVRGGVCEQPQCLEEGGVVGGGELVCAQLARNDADMAAGKLHDLGVVGRKRVR